MLTLDNIYTKFGEVSEAAQLLETELGSMLLEVSVIEEDLVNYPDSEKATEIYKKINKHTLGQLINKLAKKTDDVSHLESILAQALATRNKLAHSFYMHHNLRKNSEEGRMVMMNDLENMHDELLEAYKAVMLLRGIDLDKLVEEQQGLAQPSGHLEI